MTMEVRPCIRFSSAFWTTRSDSVSRALVASSRMSRDGFFMIALAMVSRCF